MAAQPGPPSERAAPLRIHPEEEKDLLQQQQQMLQQHSTQLVQPQPLQPQAQSQRTSDLLTLHVSPRSSSPHLAVNGIPDRSNQSTPSFNVSLNGHGGYANGAISPQVSPVHDVSDDEQHDRFDTHKDFSTSPRNSHNNSRPSSPQPHSHYTPSTSAVPDILHSVDRTLLPIIAPFNFLDQATLSARLATLNVTKQGFLDKRQSAPTLGSWRYNRRFVLIRDNQWRYDSGRKDEPLKGGMELQHVAVERSEMDPTVLYLDVSQWWKYSGVGGRQAMGERRMEWQCESEEEREAWVQTIEESKMMHEVYPLNKELHTQPPYPIVLILGLPSSGKSTVFKHVMAWRPASYNAATPEVSRAGHAQSISSFSPRVGEQVKHASNSRHRLDETPSESDGYMPTEGRIGWRKRIFQHVLKGLCVLGDAVDEHAVSSEWVYAHQVLETEREKIRVDEDEHATLDKHTLEYIHRVWSEPLVRAAWERMRWTDEWVRTLKPLLDKVDVMTSGEWVPSFQDVYHCYHALPIMTWKQVDAHSPHRFRVYDIGGSAPMDRVDRWKLERFTAASLLIYTVDLTAFDKPSTVSPRHTLLQESLLLYQQLLCNAMYGDWGPIHVYFTCADLLTQKLQTARFADSVPGYDGANEKGAVIRCVMAMFQQVGGARYSGRAVSAVDRAEMRRAVNDDIERRRGEVLARLRELGQASPRSLQRGSSAAMSPMHAAASPRGAALSSPRAMASPRG